MKITNNKTRYLTILAMFCSILVVMGVTGIGFIPLPLIKATTMHIPVILGAVLLGPAAGGILGGVFGLCSMWTNTVTPSVLSFAFSPFMTSEGLLGVCKSIWIAMGCRVLFGIAAGFLWNWLKKVFSKQFTALAVSAAVSSMLHTVLVMGSIYVLLAQQYAAAKNVAMNAVFGLIMGTVTVSGIPEAILASVLVAVIGKTLLKILAGLKKR